jgi:U32 family peptidase
MLRTPAIMSPVDRVEEVEELLTTGATELYCGVVTEEWVDRYSIAASNRRVEVAANFKSFTDLAACIDIARSFDTPVFLTMNEHYYTAAQYPMLMGHIRRAVEAGIAALIVSDPALMLVLSESDIDVPIHVSTGGAVLNSRAAKFYRELGASRVTLDRQLTLSEMRDLVADIPRLQTAVFVLNSRCANIDGLCTFDHSPFRCPDPSKFLGEDVIKACDPHAFSRDIIATGACMLPYQVDVLDPPFNSLEVRDKGGECERAMIAKQLYWNRHHIDDIPCAACALYDMVRMGIDSLKIVGRGNPTNRKTGDIGFIKMLLELLRDEKMSRGQYVEHARNLYEYNYRRACKREYCYYPQVESGSKVKTG